MKKSLKFAAVIFVLSLCAAPVWAQVMGTVKGVAKDEAGKPIAGATVEITNPENGKKYDAKTNNAGEYVSQVEPGKYSVTLIQNNAPVLQFNGVPVTPTSGVVDTIAETITLTLPSAAANGDAVAITYAPALTFRRQACNSGSV